MNTLNKQEIISIFGKLAISLQSIAENAENEYIKKASITNPWFNEVFIRQALVGLGKMLNKDKLAQWLDNYNLTIPNKTIGIIAAGNIPLVAFHDVLCIVCSGNKALVKLSSKDKWLYLLVIEELSKITKYFDDRIIFTDETLKGIDAIIATGSDNSARYFEYYFGKYPNIIRKNRNSIAIIDGTETKEELKAFSNDIFSYFGLGCRNISQIFIPHNYDIVKLIDAFEGYAFIADQTKYYNNYEYQKTIHLLNQIPIYDNGFTILKENDGLSSPIGVLHYTRYKHIDEINNFQEVNKHKIQCAVSKTKMKFPTYCFGMAQEPELWDYADNIDTMQFLINL